MGWDGMDGGPCKEDLVHMHMHRQFRGEMVVSGVWRSV